MSLSKINTLLGINYISQIIYIGVLISNIQHIVIPKTIVVPLVIHMILFWCEILLAIKFSTKYILWFIFISIEWYLGVFPFLLYDYSRFNNIINDMLIIFSIHFVCTSILFISTVDQHDLRRLITMHRQSNQPTLLTIASMPRAKPPDDWMCVICLEGHTINNIETDVRSLACNHMVHRDCVEKLYDYNYRICPLCRV
uniref:RING-type domain-containing protein n=1 Tax=Megaviridae environmental sample TaxID=1737588 RepID=A0A5J6VK39_9VIRU|nr:MAG: hypothetical protein [Megaviridae environmental sample]